MREYTRPELESMTVAEIKALASESGIAISKTKKTEIIDQFMEGQKCTQTMDITSSHTVVIS